MSGMNCTCALGYYVCMHVPMLSYNMFLDKLYINYITCMCIYILYVCAYVAITRTVQCKVHRAGGTTTKCRGELY